MINQYQQKIAQQINIKTDYCFYCYTPISAPLKQSIVRCSNRQCKKMNVFLCHIINPQQPKQFNDIVCLKCSNNLILINCPQCKGFQGFSKSFQNFKNGMKYQCECGYLSTIVYCNNCQSIISIKGSKSHQLALIKCKNCIYSFRYKICQACKMMVYQSQFDNSEVWICLNSNCIKSEVLNPYDMGNRNNNDNQLYLNRLTRFQNQEKGFKNTVIQKELCKICLNQQANMINTKCYHLAVCQKCSYNLKKSCPICRAMGGQYKKIFKA